MGIPSYFDVVSHPRSLSTIKNQLANNPHYTQQEFERDMHLIVENAQRFNGTESEIGVLAGELERYYRSLKREMDGVGKRKATGGDGGGGGKKAKLG
jgi:hypothetical protein